MFGIDLRASFRPALPSADGLRALPAGGERLGGITVCSALTRELGPTHAQQVAALFKGFYCLGEAQPYETWDLTGPEAAACGRELLAWQGAFEAPEGDAFLDGLVEGCAAVLNAQRAPARPVNPARYLRPGEVVGFDPGEVLTSANLVLGLDGRWNSLTGLFRAADRTFLVEWWTNA